MTDGDYMAIMQQLLMPIAYEVTTFCLINLIVTTLCL